MRDDRARRTCRARHARRRPGAVPQRRRRAAANRAWTRRRELVPVVARRALHDGRRRDRPRRRARRCRASTPSARRLHGPARRQPPGVQLPERVLRLRRAAPRSRRSPSRALAGAGDAPAAERSRRRPRETRERAVARRRARADAEGLRTLLDDAHPLARLDRAVRAAARGDPRRPHQRSDFPERDAGARRAPRRGRRRRSHRSSSTGPEGDHGSLVNANSDNRDVPPSHGHVTLPGRHAGRA